MHNLQINPTRLKMCILLYYILADCGMPPRLPNAVIIAPGPTTEGSEIVYGCTENHVSEGDPSIFCKKDGLWTEPTLYCRRMSNDYKLGFTQYSSDNSKAIFDSCTHKFRKKNNFLTLILQLIVVNPHYHR